MGLTNVYFKPVFEIDTDLNINSYSRLTRELHNRQAWNRNASYNDFNNVMGQFEYRFWHLNKNSTVLCFPSPVLMNALFTAALIVNLIAKIQRFLSQNNEAL